MRGPMGRWGVEIAESLPRDLSLAGLGFKMASFFFFEDLTCPLGTVGLVGVLDGRSRGIDRFHMDGEASGRLWCFVFISRLADGNFTPLCPTIHMCGDERGWFAVGVFLADVWNLLFTTYLVLPLVVPVGNTREEAPCYP